MLSNLSLLARRSSGSAAAITPASSSIIIRSMAAGVTDAAHRPPLDLYGLTARYANAAYIAASKTSTLDKVEEELLAIKASSERSKEFASFLENPLISRDNKVTQITTLLKGKTTPVTMNLMTTLAGNARLSSIGSVTDNYVQLMKAKRGEVEATIISAEPLSKDMSKAVSEAMKSQFPKGAKVVLKEMVNPTILGGLQIQIGNKFLDLSVTSRIDEVSRFSI
jgi:F-type H+-transporting ATPase subunit O